MDYGGKYLKIRKALHEAGFDEFHQAGSVSRFHKWKFGAKNQEEMADQINAIRRKIEAAKGGD